MWERIMKKYNKETKKIPLNLCPFCSEIIEIENVDLQKDNPKKYILVGLNYKYPDTKVLGVYSSRKSAIENKKLAKIHFQNKSKKGKKTYEDYDIKEFYENLKPFND